MTMRFDPDNAGSFDVAEVQHLASGFGSGDPTVDGYVVADEEVPWVLVGICLLCAIVAPALGLITVHVARHWLGLLQISATAATLTVAALGIDRLIGAVAYGGRRSR